MDISFYLPEKYAPNEAWLQAWKQGSPLPLEESGKAAAVHCWIYQTWALLKEAGMKTSLVHTLPSKGIIIALSGTLPSTLKTNFNSEVFLVDIVADGLPHPAAQIHLLQNKSHTSRLQNSYFMPLWPQAGLIPREISRTTLFKKVAFFGDPKNLAPELSSSLWKENLRKKLALNFEIKRSHQWHDYSNIDAVIAIRDFSRAHQLHKPATKLYNAWLAGVPFIGGHDSAYKTDGHPGRDYLIADSPKQVLEHLTLLKKDVSFRLKLIQNGFESVAQFEQSATLERWKVLLQKTLPQKATQWQKKSLFQKKLCALSQQALCTIDKYWRS